MARGAAAFECFDDDHASAALGTGTGEDRRFVVGVFGWLSGVAFWLWLRHTQQQPCLCNVFRPTAIGEQAIVADAMKAAWQNVGEEAADELMRFKRHGLVALAAFDPVVFVFEGDAFIIHRNQATVGDGDAVRVAR